MDLNAAVASMPFAGGLGVGDVVGDTTGITATIRWGDAYTTLGGALHGGYLMAVADSLGALLAFLQVTPGGSTSTIESKTNMMAAITEGTATVTVTPLHVGRTTAVVQTDIHRADGRLAVRTTQTQSLVRPG